MSDLEKSFFAYLKFEKRYSEHTLSAYHSDLAQFTRYLLETFEISPESAGRNQIRSFIIYLGELNLKSKSIHRKIAALRTFFKFLRMNGDIPNNPCKDLALPKTEKAIPHFIEQNHIFYLLDSVSFEDSFIGKRDKVVLEILYGTGIRLQELLDLKISDIQKDKISVIGKGSKQRFIPLNLSLWQLIKEYESVKRDEFSSNYDDFLVVNNKGKKAYPMLIYRIVKKYLSQIPTLEKRSPHVLRHTLLLIY